jgi:putative oxidoreductase
VNWPSATHALLRIMTGFLFVPHGYQKLFGLGGVGPKEGALPLIAGLIELIGGTLIILGWQTRWVAFLCSGLMAAAYFMAHASGGFLPLLNRGETAVLYCFVFLYFWANGSGAWSLDNLIANRKSA